MFDLPRMQSEPEGTGEVTLDGGRTQLSSYTTAAKVPWHVRCDVENTHVLQEVQASIERQLSVSIPLFLLAFAGFLWIGRDLDLMHRHTRRMALSDALTGLANVRQLEQDLHRAISVADRTDRPVSFIMLDLDNFKQFNDLRGHRAGDAALKAAATVVKDAVRGRDACYRYGGEEFCVLLPDTDADGAYSVAERIRRQIAGSEVRLDDGTTAPITVSAGVATYPANSNTAEDLINCSDAALYRAKDQGRNTVCVSDRTPGPHPIG
jgi:diguanylate cyclase (GGDEF)-like protein